MPIVFVFFWAAYVVQKFGPFFSSRVLGSCTEMAMASFGFSWWSDSFVGGLFIFILFLPALFAPALFRVVLGRACASASVASALASHDPESAGSVGQNDEPPNR